MPKTINFFDGAASSTVPTIGNVDTTSLISYADDATYEAANAGSPTQGNIYFNTTSNIIRYYDGTSWLNIAKDAGDLPYDNGSSGLTATDTQGAIDEVEGRLDTAESSLSTAQTDVANLETLSGVSGATDNGTFTGTTIPDSSTTKAALQSLETEVETKIASSEKGSANGVATLDGSGKVPSSQLTVSAFEYLGTWDASTNTPTLADGVGDTGDTYRVSVAGTQDLGSGNITFAIGDRAVYNPSGDWEKWGGSGVGDLWGDPVDDNIVPDTDNTYDIGSSSNRFQQIFTRNLESKGSNTTSTGAISSTNSNGDAFCRIQGGFSTPTGVNQSAAFHSLNDLPGDLAVYTNNNSTADGNATKDVAIESGNKTAGTGNSGNIKLTVGTSAGGSQGEIKLQKSGVANTVGDVWTATSTDGEGYWSAPVSGASALNDLTDVEAGTPSDRDFISYNSGSGDWEKKDIDSSADDGTFGSNVTLAAVATSVVRLTNGSLTSIDMIPAGFDGQKFILVNRIGGTFTINDNTGATPANQICTGTGGNLVMEDDTTLSFYYDATEARWQIGAGSGAMESFPNLNNDQALTGRNNGDTLDFDLIKVDTSDNVLLGSVSANTRVVSTNFLPNGSTGNMGGGSNTWNIYPERFRSSIQFDGNFATIKSEDDTATDPMNVKSGDSSAGNSGDVNINSGAATGGNSGNILIGPGSASGTKGEIRMQTPLFASSTVGDVLALQNTSTGEVEYASAPFAANRNVASYSSTTTASVTDDVIILSGASFTLTLFTAVGNSGKIVEILHNGTSLTQVYTVDGNAAESIRGNTTFALHTNGQRVRLVSDGSNWVVLDHYTATAWIDGGTASSLISAETTAPTPATTVLVDKVWWRRVGNSMEIRYEYKHTNNSGSAAGSGDYIFTLPGSQSLDTTVLEEVSTNTSFDLRSTIGHGVANATASFAKVGAYPYDSTGFRLFGLDATTYIEVGSGAGSYPMNNGAAGYAIKVTAPIDGWEH